MINPVSKTLKQRLLKYIRPNPETHCWEWTGVKNNRGYGTIFIGGRHQKNFAHRVCYELYKGPIPDGLELDHLCRTRHCVNPDHLEAVTQKTNWERGAMLAALYHNSKSCRNGHEYTPENTYINPTSGKRICRQCKREFDTSFRAKNPHYQRDYSRIRRKKSD